MIFKNLAAATALVFVTTAAQAFPVYFCKYQDLEKRTHESEVTSNLCWAVRTAQKNCNKYYQRDDDSISCRYYLPKANCIDLTANGKDVAIESCFR